MQIRPMRASDLERATELLRQLGYHMSLDGVASRITNVTASDAHYAAVAVAGEKLLGLIHVFERPALEKPCQAVVQSLVIDKGARRTGVGRELMAAAEAWARQRGLRHVVLHTRIDRDHARAFYEGLGYQRAATAHLMSKSLRSA
jgi:ribosomal protein S18 acetylase RimI-like enzyme